MSHIATYRQRPTDVLVLPLSRLGREYRIGEHFTLAEMACNDGSDIVLVHPALIVTLQEIRRQFSRPVRINSGYRTAAYNRRVGGASESQHVRGMAADIVVSGVPVETVARFAEAIGCGGIGRYPTFTHIDVAGQGRRWRG